MKNKLYLVILFFLPLATFGQVGMWTWVNGDNTGNSLGHFGIQGVADSANTPPGFYEPCEWTDLQGNFWLFGGADQYGNAWGDLWKYNVAINEWTWIKGTGNANDTGSYGIIGLPNIDNRPPSRGWGVPTWVDLNGNLWLYGGGVHAYNLNDLWEYSITSNQWMWVNGSSGRNTITPVYGTNGVPSPANTPGGRYECSATWVDLNNDLWLFGGFSGTDSYNDLWMYNIESNEWTWMNGADTLNQPSNYGLKGLPAINNVPGARAAYCSWTLLTSDSNTFWLMGGCHFTDSTIRPYNDMWMYDPVYNEWTWMSGSNQLDNYGSYDAVCSSSVNFCPSSRFENRARWTDNCGNFWLYGGAQDGYGDTTYSDLWCFNPKSLKWTLSNGSSSLCLSPVYSTKSMASASNTPGARFGSVAWKSNAGNLYLFGGWIDTSTDIISGILPYNDLWEFIINPSCGDSIGCGNPTQEGIEEVTTQNTISIYPNPTTETVNIILSQPCNNCTLTLTDITGRQVIQRSLNGKQTTIDMSAYTSGIYIISIKTGTEIKTAKVVKE